MMDVWLFSPQIYHQLHSGHSVVNGDEVVMKFCKEGASISIPIDRNATNLPVVHNSFVFKKVKREHASKFRSALHSTGLYAVLDYFAKCVSRPKFVNVVEETGSRFQLPMCWRSEEQELVDAPERVTPLALETWHWDATSTSNDAKLNL